MSLGEFSLNHGHDVDFGYLLHQIRVQMKVHRADINQIKKSEIASVTGCSV